MAPKGASHTSRHIFEINSLIFFKNVIYILSRKIYHFLIWVKQNALDINGKQKSEKNLSNVK